MAKRYPDATAADFGDIDMMVESSDPFCRYGTYCLFDFGSADVAAQLAVLTSTTDILNVSYDDTVTARPSSVNLPVYSSDHGSLAFLPATRLPLTIQDTGVSAHQVCNPKTEGFIDFLVIGWVKMTALPASTAAAFGVGRAGTSSVGGTATISTAGVIGWSPGTATSAGTLSVDTWAQIAVAYTFDVGANTSVQTTYKDGVLVATNTAAAAPTAYVDSDTGLSKAQIGGTPGYTVFTGEIAQVYREYIENSGFTALERVEADYVRFRAAVASGRLA